MKRRLKLAAGVAVVVLVAGLLYTHYHKGSTTTASSTLRTVAVQRGLVQQTASAPGTVSAPTDLALNFQNSGILTAVDVQAGEAVTAGQVLATEDPTTANNQLAQAKANLVAAQAKLTQVSQGPTAQTRAQDQVALTQAQAAVTQAQTSLADTQASVAQDAVNLQAAVTQAQASLAGTQASVALDQSSATGTVSPATALKDQQSLDLAQNAVTNAVNNQKTGTVKDQQSLHQAQNSLTNAQNALASTVAANAAKEAPALPGDLATAQAAVQTAQLAVNQAQLAVTQTTLVAPVAGVVASVANQAGELVSGGGASSSSSTSSASSSSASSSSASKGFIQLAAVSNLQVVAGFAETDAVNIKLNQPVTISFNALPSVSLAGHVVAVDTQPTVVSNVVTYNVTIAFDQTSPLVRDGMSANATVVVNQVNNVAFLPSLAIRSVGGQTSVTTLVNGKQSTVPISVGLQGDTDTQILGGVDNGTTVVLPTLTTTTTSTTGRPGGGGGFGGGGIRLGG